MTSTTQQRKKSDNIFEVSVWQKAIYTRLNWDKFQLEIFEKRYIDIEDDYVYWFIILDGEHKWKYSFLYQSELDSSIEFLSLK